MRTDPPHRGVILGHAEQADPVMPRRQSSALSSSEPDRVEISDAHSVSAILVGAEVAATSSAPGRAIR